MKLIFLTFILFLLSSCGSMTYSVKKHSANIPIVKLPSKNKNLFISFLPQDCDNKAHLCNAYRCKAYLDDLTKELSSWNKFKSIKNYISNQKNAVSLLKNADYYLQVKAEEKNPEFDSIGSRILRTLSLGFYGQEVKSTLVVEFHLLDVKKQKHYSGKRVFQVNSNYKLRGLMYPFNLNKNIEFSEDQAKLYSELTMPILKEIFNQI